MSRLPPLLPVLASVAAGSVLLYGCAVGVDGRPERPRSPDVRQHEGVARLHGHIAARAGRPGVVVAAPHGAFDARTAEIADAIARRTGFGLVVARGFSMEPDARGRMPRRYHVNRPMEGVPGKPVAEERATAQARQVRAHPEVARLHILVEPVDRVVYTASGDKREGILTLPLQALHVELPRRARVDFPDVYTSVLADFLRQAVSLPPGR